MAYRRILAAVDFTDDADAVLAAARELAWQHVAWLTALTVVKPLVKAYGGFDLRLRAAAGGSFEGSVVDEVNRRLGELARAHEADEFEAVIGNPAEVIHDYVNRRNIDLLVIGTHGRSGVGRLLGSTANAVLRGANCDVLAVKLD